MQTQSTDLNFEGQNLYIGIDVHLKSWTVSILSETLMHKTFTQPADAKILSNYLNCNFPGGIYHSVYEAGFCGFYAHYMLKALGINNIIVNPADVPTTQKEHLQKDDPTDSRKLARSLRGGELRPIHIPEPSTIEDRSLIRMRTTLVKDISRNKNRIKSFLYLHGIPYPPQFQRSGTHWSKRFIKWLKEEVTTKYYSGTYTLKILLQEVEQQRNHLLEVTRQIRLLAQSETYAKNIALLRTIPGIGLLTAIIIITELETITRFENPEHLAGFIGMVPNRHSSGEKNRDGEMTFRGKKSLKSALIESSWIAARTDPALLKCFNRYINQMESNKAITKIARKLVNRIYFVLKNEAPYVTGVVK